MKYLPYVHLTQGTQSCFRFSHGNCLPLTQLPFSMAGFTLQTDTENTPWFFSPDSRGLEGIRLTHQPSPWIRGLWSIALVTANRCSQNGTQRTVVGLCP